MAFNINDFLNSEMFGKKGPKKSFQKIAARLFWTDEIELKHQQMKLITEIYENIIIKLAFIANISQV